MGGIGKSAHPIVSSVQKMALYETKSRFYLVGSNNTQTKFRVLKIDRTEPKELVINDDKIEYTQKEIRDLLMMIDVGNRSKHSQSSGGGLSRTVSAFGIVGFIRFLEGFYLILMTKRRRVAMVGHHTIYKIEDISMIYIPHDSVRCPHRDEAKYMKMFQNIDLSSNFYFSYSYDLTHTLQYNMTVPKRVLRSLSTTDSSFEVIDECSKTLPVWDPHHCVSPASKSSTIEVAQNFLPNLQKSGRSKFYSDDKNAPWSELKDGLGRQQSAGSQGTLDDESEYGITTNPRARFVWNSYLLKRVEHHLHPNWVIHIIHGFVGQSNISTYGKPIFLTLIARRSNRFAGTRFLKRGANSAGDVANEVETEQIVHDASISSFSLGNYTSYVQLRGSIPSYWSQDISTMVPKPPIMFVLADPFCYTAGLHFNNLMLRYGSPIIILNLVKKREKKRHESILSEDYNLCIEYLNTFLPPELRIQQIELDMARINKLKEANVLQKLSDISFRAVKNTGIFHNQQSYYSQTLRPSSLVNDMKGFVDKCGTSTQTGVLRVNCVDCLDRTNTAQFAISRCALAFQLYAIGVLDKPELELDTDCLKMLEELYEDHGDTLALQYGGSQLVHRIKSYRKIAPMSSHTRDIMQTLSRYYSNAFSDSDKQNAMNLFLGVFVPEDGKRSIWELSTDYYLQNPLTSGRDTCHRKLYSKWWDDSVLATLPRPSDEVKGDAKAMEIVRTHSGDMRIDGFFEHYRPYEFSVLADQFEFNISSTVRDYMPGNTIDFSPFAVRNYSHGRLCPKDRNPSVSGALSTGSAASSSGSCSEDDIDQEFPISDADLSSLDSPSNHVSFKKLFSTMKQTYGMEPKKPSRADMIVYRKYVGIGQYANDEYHSTEKLAARQTFSLIRQSVFSLDSLYHVTPPTVSRRDKDVYSEYMRKCTIGNPLVPNSSKLLYQKYAARSGIS